MEGLKLADMEALRRETEIIGSKIQDILKEGSERLDCSFSMNLTDAGEVKIFAVLDRNKYSLT